jgi:hypothetical protein
MNAIRWSDNDRYFGRFTYARERYSRVAVMFGSGDGDDYPGCRLRVSIGRHTVIAALPQILKPHRRWVDTSHYEWSKGPGSGYWDTHEREFGFTTFEGSLHVHYGAQTNEWPGTKSKVLNYPWRKHRHIRHSLYDLDGELFGDLPEWGFSRKNGWAVKDAIEAVCPVARFEFADFDGERIVATTRIEEREWVRGKGLFRLLFLGRNTIRRDLDIRFSAETGKRKGSWKGGTVGHSIDMLPGELHEAAFRRYCAENGMTFIAQAGEAGTAETVQQGSVHEHAVRAADAPKNRRPFNHPQDCGGESK